MPVQTTNNKQSCPPLTTNRKVAPATGLDVSGSDTRADFAPSGQTFVSGFIWKIVFCGGS
jgi:hypothetical protein